MDMITWEKMGSRECDKNAKRVRIREGFRTYKSWQEHVCVVIFSTLALQRIMGIVVKTFFVSNMIFVNSLNFLIDRVKLDIIEHKCGISF